MIFRANTALFTQFWGAQRQTPKFRVPFPTIWPATLQNTTKGRGEQHKIWKTRI